MLDLYLSEGREAVQSLYRILGAVADNIGIVF